jgi:hypothetical protein
MSVNVSFTDRIIRIILAMIIFAVGYWNRSWFGLLGFLPLITALIGYCPLYSLLGISTKK